jgi:hypothetical protein
LKHRADEIAARALMNLPDDELNTYIARYQGTDAVTQYEDAARTSGADSKFYKALALAHDNPNEAEAIIQSLKKHRRTVHIRTG